MAKDQVNESPTMETAPGESDPARTTAHGTAERVSFPAQDAPLSNQQVRELRTEAAFPAELQAQLDAAEEKLRRQTLAEAGVEPEEVEHRIFVTPGDQAGVHAPGAEHPVGTFFGQATNYIVGERDIFASSVGQFITSYTLDAAAISADADGNKIVFEGTVLQASGAKVAPRTSGTAVGVLRHRVNARLGDQDIGMVVGGRLNINKLWDNGTFGTVASQARTDLAAIGIILQSYDV